HCTVGHYFWPTNVLVKGPAETFAGAAGGDTGPEGGEQTFCATLLESGDVSASDVDLGLAGSQRQKLPEERSRDLLGEGCVHLCVECARYPPGVPHGEFRARIRFRDDPVLIPELADNNGPLKRVERRESSDEPTLRGL
ncbi:MAG: hypothetical protein Q9187_009436, partial [Circinaria calcarea]